MSPRFLTVEEVAEIHRDQIERYGGSLGVRDVGLLELAVSMPQSGIGDQFLHADIFEMAAAYLYHIVKNHPFVDGNKRVGSMAAYTFLRVNEDDVEKTSEENFQKLVLAMASSTASKHDAVAFFKKHAKNRKKKRRRRK